ncbi:MAG: hypothetical protein EZS28_023606 [Streblomastix strix]|uniref:Uncharacterized protein n=1 Tax=Streblomastix strix TaxID=222440 RepID=A0A5J4VEB5_9EUKA|nr:MAG: hypothetical protein EZS28_023606 [Streblomastix strix]
MKVEQSQCVGIESPWTLTKEKKMSQFVGMRNPQTLTSDKQLVQCVWEIVRWTLQYKKKNNMETSNDRIMNNLKNKCKLEDYIQESMYPPQSNSINTDQQNTYHQNRLKDPARVVSTSPIENHQIQTNWPIGGRLIHFLDIWKLIKAETLITRESIQRESRSTRSTNLEGVAGGNSRRSVSELTEWINPCFAIPKKDKGKWRKITDCSLLNEHLQSTHFIMEDIQGL